MSFDNYRAGGDDSAEAQWQREREAERRIPVDGALAALRESMSGLAKLVNGNASRELYVSAMAAVECLAMAIEQAQAAERAAHPPHVATSDASIEARAKAAAGCFYIGDGLDFMTSDAHVMALWCNVVRAVDASRPDPAPSPGLVEALYQLRRETLAGDMTPERARALRDRFRAVERIVHDPEHARVTMTPLDRLRVIAGLVLTLPHGKASHEVALGHSEPAFAMLREAGATMLAGGTLLRTTLHLGGVRFTAQKDGEGVST